MANKDPEKRRAYARQWYEKNKEAVLTKQAWYRVANREKRNIAERAAYQANIKEKRRSGRLRQWRARNKDIEKARLYGRQYYAANKEKHLAKRKRQYAAERLKKYGLTPESYELLLKQQYGRCAICCDQFTKTPHIDHCHVSMKVRGLLCGRCNHGIGLFRESPEALSNAVKYLCFHSRIQIDGQYCITGTEST